MIKNHKPMTQADIDAVTGAACRSAMNIGSLVADQATKVEQLEQELAAANATLQKLGKPAEPAQ